jgi:hypothetical protein
MFEVRIGPMIMITIGEVYKIGIEGFKDVMYNLSYYDG